MAHAVFDRLRQRAKEGGEDMNLLLVRYGTERLLYRLSQSKEAERFVLKGASLLLVWRGRMYRVTRDVDLLALGDAGEARLTMFFRELCRMDSEEVDGLVFLPETVQAMPIREEQAYGGMRVLLRARLHRAHIRLQVDVGVGDAITPAVEEVTFPTLLDGPAPVLNGYPRYTVVAEKVEAMVRLGMANSRMKDFYDVWLMSRLFAFEGNVLATAIARTFERRKTVLPGGVPTAFLDTFTQDEAKVTQWNAFVRKAKPDMVGGEFASVVGEVAAFVMPAMTAAAEERPLAETWSPVGPWE